MWKMKSWKSHKRTLISKQWFFINLNGYIGAYSYICHSSFVLVSGYGSVRTYNNNRNNDTTWILSHRTNNAVILRKKVFKLQILAKNVFWSIWAEHGRNHVFKRLMHASYKRQTHFLLLYFQMFLWSFTASLKQKLATAQTRRSKQASALKPNSKCPRSRSSSLNSGKFKGFAALGWYV